MTSNRRSELTNQRFGVSVNPEPLNPQTATPHAEEKQPHVTTEKARTPPNINVEIKAQVRDFDELRREAQRISDTPEQVLTQEDTFFDVPFGRLKLRATSHCSGELIYYERADQADARESTYLISRTNEIQTMKAILGAALGVRGIVEKTRYLYQVGETRIHLDEVHGLGRFVELEVVLRHDQTLEYGRAVIERLMHVLGIAPKDLVSGAYIDLCRDSKQ